MWNNSFNLAVIAWFNQYSQLSPKLNHAITYIEHAYAFKGLAIVSLLWYLWFKYSDVPPDKKVTIIGTILGCILALFITSAINYITPFQPTPIANTSLHFQMPIGIALDRPSNAGHGWINSFPSHHATIFYALAMGIYLTYKPLGYLAFAYVTVFIIFPRIYLGYHYPTDVIVGAAVGMFSAKLMNQKSIRATYEKPCVQFLKKCPAAFQTIVFIIMFEIAVIFSDVLGLVQGFAKHLF